ncbi:MAG: NADH-quinone oxidoreductase subunit H, partial [Puniceicoccaceae bacterium]
MNPVLQSFLVINGILIGLLTLAGLLVWVERRLLAFFQDRLGPNRCGPFGLFIFVADGIKLMNKEDWIPPHADKPAFILAPTFIVITALLAFSIIPVAPGIQILDLN